MFSGAGTFGGNSKDVNWCVRFKDVVRHLGAISSSSRRHLCDISAPSRLYLGCISATSRYHLARAIAHSEGHAVRLPLKTIFDAELGEQVHHVWVRSYVSDEVIMRT